MKLSDTRPKAVALGLLLDISGSIGTGLILGIVIGFVASQSGDTSRAHLAALNGLVGVELIGLVGTVLFSGVGGFVAALEAKTHGFENALAVGFLDVLLSSILLMISPGLAPAWKISIGLILTIPAALVGGKLAKK